MAKITVYLPLKMKVGKYDILVTQRGRKIYYREVDGSIRKLKTARVAGNIRIALPNGTDAVLFDKDTWIIKKDGKTIQKSMNLVKQDLERREDGSSK